MANKKRLIDADEALLNTYNEIYWTESEAAAVRSFLVHQKSVDAVEVVRCKDCKLYNGHRYCLYFVEEVLDDDFCSYGERRNDG